MSLFCIKFDLYFRHFESFFDASIRTESFLEIKQKIKSYLYVKTLIFFDILNAKSEINKMKNKIKEMRDEIKEMRDEYNNSLKIF